MKYPYGLINYHKTTQNIEKYKQSLEEIVKDEEIYNNQCEEEQKNLDRIKALKEELKNNINNITTKLKWK